VNPMEFNEPITRRESIRRLLRWSGCVTLAGAVQWPSFTAPDAWATTAPKELGSELGSDHGELLTIKGLC